MTLIHIVLIRFKPEATQEQRHELVHEVKKLKDLPSVKNGRLIVGGPSLADPIELSKGFEFAAVSYHENAAAIKDYQASEEYQRFVSTYIYPFSDDLCRFDFEVNPEDEYMCTFGPFVPLEGQR
ncbi:hypothetical protein ONS95_012532 [Cadophora gregata]|uniref:uncharacterized protein n=1 Tax=Cadophora gregata TaxID=51156 RepID=UPI0026DD52F1|nr:uncharacterized protein ONS95_012532 [Cadophora gregata]KAK0118229.1 hypothetical protein ONS95_012532 [Cadophora gregata]